MDLLPGMVPDQERIPQMKHDHTLGWSGGQTALAANLETDWMFSVELTRYALGVPKGTKLGWNPILTPEERAHVEALAAFERGDHTPKVEVLKHTVAEAVKESRTAPTTPPLESLRVGSKVSAAIARTVVLSGGEVYWQPEYDEGKLQGSYIVKKEGGCAWREEGYVYFVHKLSGAEAPEAAPTLKDGDLIEVTAKGSLYKGYMFTLHHQRTGWANTEQARKHMAAGEVRRVDPLTEPLRVGDLVEVVFKNAYQGKQGRITKGSEGNWSVEGTEHGGLWGDRSSLKLIERGV